jgi:hypothetical protein
MEIIVVVFLLALVSAVAVPRITLMSGQGLKTEAGRMASTLRLLSDSSTARKSSLSVTFDFTKGAMSWDHPSGGTREAAMHAVTGVTLLSRGLVSGGQLTVWFDPSGMNEFMTVHMAAKGGGRYDVIFNPISRRVKVEQLPTDDGARRG